ALSNKIGCFSQVVLRSNCLQLRILEPVIQRTHSRRITTEDFIGKGVDLVNRNLHNDLPNTESEVLSTECSSCTNHASRLSKIQLQVDGTGNGVAAVRRNIAKSQ